MAIDRPLRFGFINYQFIYRYTNDTCATDRQCMISIGVNTDIRRRTIANTILLLSEQCNGECINLNMRHLID